MILPWAIFLFFTGAVFGWIAAGRGVRSSILATALLSGLVLAAVAVGAGVYTGARPLGFPPTVVGITASLIGLVSLYALGAWIGSLVAGRGDAAILR